MSIVSLARSSSIAASPLEAARTPPAARPNYPTAPTKRGLISPGAPAARQPALQPNADVAPEPDEDSSQSGKKKVADAFDALTEFIPAETVTLFVAATGIISGWKTTTNDQSGTFLAFFLIFLCLSPLFYIVAAIVSARSSGETLSRAKVAWRLFALTIAFVVWACAISHDTMVALVGALRFHLDASAQAHLRDVLSIIVLVTSAVLKTIDRLFK